VNRKIINILSSALLDNCETTIVIPDIMGSIFIDYEKELLNNTMVIG
jgi:hypothetical protein